MGRKPPRWTIAFLRALERTGEVEAAARDAGIDKSTAYLRRKSHPDFAESWEEALRLHAGRADEEVKERVGFWGRVKAGAFPASVTPPPAPRHQGEGRRKDELLASTALGGQVRRVGPGRWNAAAEQSFFDELAASANVKRACAAAGVSTNAVYARRMKRPDFRAKWDAVLETGRAAIEMHLVAAAKTSFEPDALDLGEAAAPNVTVAEAIRIVQLHGSKAERQSIEQIEPPEEEIDAVRERLFRKLERLRKRELPNWLAQGWSHDESFDQMVPPGWVKGPDYRPCERDPEERDGGSD